MPVLPVAGNRLAEAICKCSRPVVHDALTDTTIPWSLYNFSSREMYSWKLIGNYCLLISRFESWVVYHLGDRSLLRPLWVCFWYNWRLFSSFIYVILKLGQYVLLFISIATILLAWSLICLSKVLQTNNIISLKNSVHSAFSCWNLLLTTHNNTLLWLFN